MTLIHVTQRPSTIPVIQWTGDNFAEIETALDGIKPVADNGDGTFTLYFGSSGATIIESGSWVICGPNGDWISDEDMANFQELPAGTGPFAFTIE